MVHKVRNIAVYCPKSLKASVVSEAKRIFYATSREEAMERFKEWKQRWKTVVPRAVECLEKDLEELLNFFDCSKRHWIKIRTTNVIERCFKEVRRRTRVFSCFSNRQSSERIIYAIFTHLNNQWGEKPLTEFTEFC